MSFTISLNISDDVYNWEIPDLKYRYSDCYFKIDIEDANYDFVDSLGNYEINPAPFVTILNSKQDTVKTNMLFEIKVDIKNALNNNYNIYYSLTKGMNWTSIAQNIDSEEMGILKNTIKDEYLKLNLENDINITGSTLLALKMNQYLVKSLLSSFIIAFIIKIISLR